MRKKEGTVKFEIIVVCFNAGAKLKTTLDSIYGQEYHNYHVIIKDANSTDGSLSELKASGYFGDRREAVTNIYSAKDKGIYDGMNEAVSYMWNEETASSSEEVACNSSDDTSEGSTDASICKHDRYVIFMNCGDVFYDKQTLGKVADFIEEKQTDMTDEPYIFYGDQYNRLTDAVVSSAPKLNEFALYRNVPCHQVCFYEDRLFEDRGYDTKYKVRADYEHFLYSVYEKKAKTCHMEYVISEYEGGGFSETVENRKLSSKEHLEITDHYMGKKAKKYRRIMTLSGAGIRTRLAESKHFSKAYNSLKSLIYGKRK